jgi:hypothetical protein
MQLVTGSNLGYYGRMTGYLDSLAVHADFPVHLVGVGFMPANAFAKCHILTREQNDGAPRETECIQHGSFLHVIKGKADDVLVYTDGDFVMQRPLDDSERELLDLDHGQVVTSWNGGAHETLEHEATRLNMRVSWEQLFNDFGHDLRKWPIYNVGFIAMTRQTWKELYAAYMRDWPDMHHYFGHQARQQWLISYHIAALGLDVKIAPWSLHAHGHFGLKPGMERRPDGIYADGKLAAFRHFL